MAILGEGTPKLGFGLMRLPKNADGTIDIDQTSQMVDEFLAAGCTYFDTARAYGESESATRRALVERHPRDSYTLATKCAAWLGANSAEEAKAFCDTSLEQTGAGYFDYYLLHNLGGKRTQIFDDWGLWDWVRGLKEDGKIRLYGFSFHDTADVLDQILDAHPDAEFVQLQINYADWENASVQSRACWEVARAHGKPVVIMEPVKGGTLANAPAPVEQILRDAMPERTPVEWALRFAMSLEGVLTVLSGMSNLEQLRQNLATLKGLTPLSPAEQDALAAARAKIAELIEVPCTNCRYCTEECPVGMPIPGIMEALNRDPLYGYAEAKETYDDRTERTAKASACIQCYQCEGACPQHIDIVHQLERAAEKFE